MRDQAHAALACPPCSAATDGEVDRGAARLHTRCWAACPLAHQPAEEPSTLAVGPAVPMLCGSVSLACADPRCPWMTLSSLPLHPRFPDLPADGYCIVGVQISAHHTGAPFTLPGLPEVAPSGRRVAMEPEFLRVRVEAEQVKEIVVRGMAIKCWMGSAVECCGGHAGQGCLPGLQCVQTSV